MSISQTEMILKSLNAQVQSVIKHYCPAKGYRTGTQYFTCCPWRNDSRPESFNICISGQKTGLWKDFATGETGNILDLIKNACGFSNIKDAFTEAKNFLGISNDADFTSKFNSKEYLEKLKRLEAEDEKKQQEAKQDKQKTAMNIFIEAHKSILDTPADLYLKNRGLDVRLLPRQTGALRYHPSVYESQTKTYMPALVAKIDNSDTDLFSVHRIYITECGKKANIMTPKKALGSVQGGWVHVWKGKNQTPITEISPNEVIFITEGIEDALAIALKRPEYRVLSSVSLANMGAIDLPCLPRGVVLFGDNDDNPQAIAQFNSAKIAWEKKVSRVVAVKPNIQGCKDANDLLILSQKNQTIKT